MRNKLRALYYPDFFADFSTIVKSILLFDEIHFMDRPAFSFNVGGGNFGLIGAASPLRSYEQPFRDAGVPFYVHQAPGGPVAGEFLEQIKTDLSDKRFLSRFQEGLRTSDHFRDLHIPRGNYGKGETQETISRKMVAIDLEKYPSPLDLFSDPKILPFEYSTAEGCAKGLVTEAMTCSAKMNFALKVGARQGFSPLADASPYANLLAAKYNRAVAAASSTGQQIPMTDLSLAILDELVRPERIYSLTIGDAIKYRKESETPREAFLEHLAALEAKLTGVPAGGDYSEVIKKIIDTEIRPAAKEFANKLDTIYDKLFGGLLKGVVGYMGTSAAVQIFGDLSWPNLLKLAGVAGAYIGTKAIDAVVEKRTASRESALSYLLDLEGHT
jgi:hypothetical protein